MRKSYLIHIEIESLKHRTENANSVYFDAENEMRAIPPVLLLNTINLRAIN